MCIRDRFEDAILHVLESCLLYTSDQDDIRELYKLCEFTTSEQGLELLVSYYPENLILPRVQFLLQEMFPEGREKSRDTGMAR